MEKNIYDDKYSFEGFYWGKEPSKSCYKVLKMKPPVEKTKLLVVGCGEGRNAVFFVRNGYDVTAFDLSKNGIEKTEIYAEELGLKVKTFTANINEYRLKEDYDVIFSTGTLHYVPKESRKELFQNYKDHTKINGLNMFSVFVYKPFIEPAPEKEETAQKWISGELMNYYHDWKIEWSIEEIFDCDSGGVPHRHAMNRIAARKIL
ncbi:MAG: methyltransferase domain-containing protein [Thermoplasmatota archaeon]